MNKSKNREVIRLWSKGLPSQNHKSTLCSLSNGHLYSYGLKIGHRTESGTCIVADYTARGGHYKSQTTSCHVGLARASADLVLHVHTWRLSRILGAMPGHDLLGRLLEELDQRRWPHGLDVINPY